MTDDTGASDAQSGDTGTTDDPETVSLPRCPHCGTPITQTSMIGPGEAIAGPCGCRVAPPDPDRSGSD
ncbi:hypothetical protein [Natrialba aegyptia]|uniref:Small CPxCG-related zinc finger protein n=1 Tax=Natrialba aegyptia DSM 13077 TaxID=1227491 RepID=M0AZ41_9EURY|nr:hypothetical protein [Natrialba aegyptia]ELZ03243.1 hypothetical protein C480_15960 [Natrialba aegyptia DSM 13077]